MAEETKRAIAWDEANKWANGLSDNAERTAPEIRRALEAIWEYIDALVGKEQVEAPLFVALAPGPDSEGCFYRRATPSEIKRAGYIPAESAAPPAAETLERWAVRVTDLWRDARSGRAVKVRTRFDGGVEVALIQHGTKSRIFYEARGVGHTDLARISVARALSAESPELPKEPGT